MTATAPGFKQFVMSVPVEAGKETQLRIALIPSKLRRGRRIRAADTRHRFARPRFSPRLDRRNAPRCRRGRGGLGDRLDRARWARRERRVLLPWRSSCCVPVYNTKTVGWILAAAGAATAAVGGVVLYGARKNGGTSGLPRPLVGDVGGHF